MTTLKPVLVWDLPLRVFHWLVAASFAGAWLTAEDEAWRGLHYALGCTTAALIVFRLAWGFAGTRYSRFSSLNFDPRAALRYLRSLACRAPEHHTGHNPAASWAIAAILLFVTVTAVSGWVAAGPGQAESLEDLHAGLATFALGLIGVHVLAVVVSSVIHRENLVRSMLTGTKRSEAGAAPVPGRSWVAALLAVSMIALWSVAPWSRLPTGDDSGAGTAQSREDADD